MKAEKTTAKPVKASAPKPAAPVVSLKPEPTEPIRKRILPLLGKGSIQIFDMKAVLR